MTPRLRITIVIALFALALIPPVLMVMAQIDPMLAVQIRRGLGLGGWSVLAAVLLAGVVASLVWPPFLPALRLGLRRLVGRMGTDQRPYYEALSKLEHLETAKGHLDVARMAHHMGNLKKALPHSVRAVELDPDLVAARFLMVRILREVGQLPEAARQARIIVRDDPDHAFGAAQVELGRTLLLMGEPQEAIDALLDHDRRNAATRSSCMLLGKAYQEVGDHDKAREWMSRAAARPADGEHLPPEDALVRARARVWLRTGVGR